MTPPFRNRFLPAKALRTLALGLAIGLAAPVAFADNLPDVQKLMKQGQFPQALEKVDAYLASRPKDAQGRFFKGLILTEMNKPTEAIGVFTKLSEDYPELPEPYNNLAVLYAQQKQYDKARVALEMAIRTHPSYAIAYENLGDVYAKLATQAYDKALQLDNSNSAAQNKLALIRDLISTSGNANVKPTIKPAPAPAVAPPPAPAPTPTASVVTTTPGAAAAPATTKPISTVAPTPQVAPAPAPAPQPAPKPDVGANNDVSNALAAWADAWSRKDVKAYLAAYAPSFNPPKGMTRKAWEKEREDRIASKPGKISVRYDTPQITVEGERATVKIRQHYSAANLKTSTGKTLVFVRSGGRWLITEEISR